MNLKNGKSSLDSWFKVAKIRCLGNHRITFINSGLTGLECITSLTSAKLLPQVLLDFY